MFVNAFIGRQEKPADSELGKIPGPAKALRDKLVTILAEGPKTKILEWKSYWLKAERTAVRLEVKSPGDGNPGTGLIQHPRIHSRDIRGLISSPF